MRSYHPTVAVFVLFPPQMGYQLRGKKTFCMVSKQFSFVNRFGHVKIAKLIATLG